MAEAEEVTEEEQPSGGNKKMIIIFAVVLLVAVGGSVAGTLFLLGGDEPAEEAEEAAPVPTKAIYHELRPAFVVHYTLGPKGRYLQTELAVMSRYPGAIDSIVTHAPLVRAKILSHLNEQDVESLQTDEGKTALQASLTGVLNDLLSTHQAEGEVETVLFSSFVMQ